MNDEAHREGDGSQTEQFWEGHYRKRERVWSGNANPILIEVAESLPSGTALDLGCGEGGDAVWLARLGWQVTAVDVSNTALHRAAAEATTADVETLIDFQKHDLTRSFPEGSFDLVSAQYLQSPIEFPRDRVLKRSAEAVAPGGLLLIVAHASVPPWSWADPGIQFPTPEEALIALDLDPGRWHTERLDAPERPAIGPNGRSADVTDNVIVLKRLTQ